VWIDTHDPQGQPSAEGLAAEDTSALARLGAFDAVANIGAKRLIRSDGLRRDEWKGLWVSSDLARALGVTPVAGRAFGAADMPLAQAPAAMLGYERWQRDFGGDPAVVGRVLHFSDNKSVTVIGVLPRGLEFPLGRAPGAGTGVEFAIGVQDFWVLGQDRPDGHPGGITIARLAPAATMASAAAEAAAAAPPGRSFAVVPFRDHALGLFAPALPLLQAFAALVLLIACANLGSLLLARAANARHEFAVRAALGAKRADLLRILLAESVLLSAGGAAAGLVLARLGQWLLAGAVPDHVALADRVAIDGAVLMFTAGLGIAAAIVFTFLPAGLARRAPIGALLDRGRGQTAGRAQARLLNALVASQVAIALVLLTGAALLVQSLWRLLSVDAGYDRGRVIAADILLYEPMREVQPFFLRLHARLRALPGVEAVGAIQSTPLTGKWTFRERVGGVDMPGSFVALDYFEAMGIALVEGRTFTPREFTVPEAPAIVINDVAARLLFPGESAIGRRIPLFGQPREIVGVVKGTRDVRLETPAEPQWYQPFLFGDSQLLVRTAGDPAASVAMLRRELLASDPRLIVKRVEPLDAIVRASVFERRVATMLLSIFAGLALTLALVGIYGVTAFTTAQRRREFGVRAALGARRRDLVALVLRRALVTAAAGIAAGIAASVPLTAALRSLMFEIAAGDPRTTIAAALALVAAAAAACALPAWRAGSVDPSITLRVE
jgi:putative ABC transport system permease protein